MSMLKHKICVLVIDSEPESMRHITELLLANPLVSTVENAIDTDHALLKIIDRNPDLILFEYPAKGIAENKFILFIQAKLKNTTMVFVSKTKEYAANAIRNEVFKYLLKPVAQAGLGKIIGEVYQNKQTNIQERINQIIETTPVETRLKFQTLKGYLIIDPKKILYCKTDSIYTELHLTNNQVEFSQLTLSKVGEMLSTFNFLRVSRTYLINQKYIRKIHRGSNTIILASDGKEYEVKGSKLLIRNLSKMDTD